MNSTCGFNRGFLKNLGRKLISGACAVSLGKDGVVIEFWNKNF
jgi:hypothetical protein